jgi:hypothetical protein
VEKITLTPVVARALEDRRRQLDSELDPRSIAEVGPESASFSDRVALMGKFKKQCRELGALDQVCEQHGISDWVSADRGEEQ